MPLTPLLAYIRQGDTAKVAHLLSLPTGTCSVVDRVSVESPTGEWYETTALFEACRTGDVDIVTMLLNRMDVDVNDTAVRVASLTKWCGE